MKNANKTKYIVYIATTVLLFTGLGCSNGSSSDGSGSVQQAAVTTLSLTPMISSVLNGTTVLLTASGGTAPYAFSTAAGAVGTIGSTTATTTIYTAPVVGSGSGEDEVIVTDSTGATATATLDYSDSSSPSGSLTVTPAMPIVSPGGNVTLDVTGGTAPYTYSAPAGEGSFVGSTYFAPSSLTATLNISDVLVTISDSAGNSIQVDIQIQATTTDVSSCEGSFSFIASSNKKLLEGTLSLVQDDNGNVMGSITWKHLARPYVVSGTCSGSTVSLNLEGTKQVWSGTLYTDENDPSTMFMEGVISNAKKTIGTWFAQ